MATEKQLTGSPEIAGDIAAELQAKKLQLHWLLQISKAINYNFTTKQLLDVYEHVLHSQLQVDRLALLIHEHQWKCALLYGTDRSFHDFELEKILDELNQLHNLEMEKELWIKSFDTIIPVFHKDRVLAYALIGGMNSSAIPKKNELIPFIQTITNLIVVAIENNIVSEEKIRQAGIKKELELAAQMQNMLFPVSLPGNDKYEMVATYLPHQEVGGDYYDFIPVNDDEFVFCMADVSGKGIPAALLMSNFQANLHAYVMHNAGLAELVKQLNANVFNSAKGEKFITFFIGRYNARTRELQYVNAGHNPPFLLHDKVVYMLNEGCTGLGMFEELPFVKAGKVFIPENALLHCYTDGVIDVENDEGSEFGIERLREFLVSKMNMENMGEMQRQLVNRLFSYKQNRSYTDDITLLSCRFGKKKTA